MMNHPRKVFFVILTTTASVVLMASGLPSSVDVAIKVERAIDKLEHPLPIIEPLFDSHLRNVSICKDPEGSYYLTGTTDDNWGRSEGIRVWKSDDLRNWKQLSENNISLEPDFDPSVLKDRGTVSSSFSLHVLGNARAGNFYDAPDIGRFEISGDK